MSQSAAPQSRVPARALLCFAAMAAAQLLAYYIPRLLLPYLTVHVLTGPLDARIPFSPPWITVYCLAFPFWIVSGLWIVSGEKSQAYRSAASYVLAMLLCCAVFLLWPGTMVRPEVTETDFFSAWVRAIYRADAPNNLCPSMHVLISCFCFRCALESKTIPRWYALFSFVLFLLISCSVLLVKQHALVDVPAGILAGELALQLGRILRLERIPFALEKRLRKK